MEYPPWTIPRKPFRSLRRRHRRNRWPSKTQPSLKDEPQTVPDMQIFGDSPPLSPINMDNAGAAIKPRGKEASQPDRRLQMPASETRADIPAGRQSEKTWRTRTRSSRPRRACWESKWQQLKQRVMNHVTTGASCCLIKCKLIRGQSLIYQCLGGLTNNNALGLVKRHISTAVHERSCYCRG